MKRAGRAREKKQAGQTFALACKRVKEVPSEQENLLVTALVLGFHASLLMIPTQRSARRKESHAFP
jgi:hypothetical protein